MKFKTPLALILFLSIFGLVAATASAAEHKDAEKNVAQFTTLKCNMCHSLERFEVKATITKEEMLGPDLGYVGDQHDAEWITQWLEGKVELEGKTHKSKWKGTAKDLEEISAWLATLKK